jgi:uncharacterized protein YegP (UPF0339 family)
MKVTIYQDLGNCWRWHITARNGKLVCTSGESFANKGNASRAAKAFIRGVLAANFHSKLHFVVAE